MADQPFTGSLKPGTKLGKYEVREQVAAGGMAVIYKAYDPSLDRHVAIKQIAPHLAQDARFAERFRSEAQTLARLSGTQANIVNVHELIEQDGQLYLVMEYVEGTTLRAMMDRGPVPLQTGLGVLLSTALGLRAMHAQTIVHRDLTPMNVMMARDGALKITDFGLIGHSGGRTSLPMGTTKYMAPEMFTGAPVDPRADLYSLGLMAYEMFAGPEKFAEVFKDVLRDERAQQVRWMHWHANASLRAPSLKEIQPGIPPLISKIVERMMEKDPSKRFASADQIIRWLRRIFVMHVQGKSISLSDSETLEKEMESEAGAAGGPAVRGAHVPAAPGA
ncbi:MAG: serine/threonine-protein kinase, partial [Phycisphaerae bacterium]